MQHLTASSTRSGASSSPSMYLAGRSQFCRSYDHKFATLSAPAVESAQDGNTSQNVANSKRAKQASFVAVRQPQAELEQQTKVAHALIEVASLAQYAAEDADRFARFDAISRHNREDRAVRVQLARCR